MPLSVFTKNNIPTFGFDLDKKDRERIVKKMGGHFSRHFILDLPGEFSFMQLGAQRLEEDLDTFDEREQTPVTIQDEGHGGKYDRNSRDKERRRDSWSSRDGEVSSRHKPTWFGGFGKPKDVASTERGTNDKYTGFGGSDTIKGDKGTGRRGTYDKQTWFGGFGNTKDKTSTEREGHAKSSWLRGFGKTKDDTSATDGDGRELNRTVATMKNTRREIGNTDALYKANMGKLEHQTPNRDNDNSSNKAEVTQRRVKGLQGKRRMETIPHWAVASPPKARPTVIVPAGNWINYNMNENDTQHTEGGDFNSRTIEGYSKKSAFDKDVSYKDDDTNRSYFEDNASYSQRVKGYGGIGISNAEDSYNGEETGLLKIEETGLLKTEETGVFKIDRDGINRHGIERQHVDPDKETRYKERTADVFLWSKIYEQLEEVDYRTDESKAVWQHEEQEPLLPSPVKKEHASGMSDLTTGFVDPEQASYGIHPGDRAHGAVKLTDILITDEDDEEDAEDNRGDYGDDSAAKRETETPPKTLLQQFLGSPFSGFSLGGSPEQDNEPVIPSSNLQFYRNEIASRPYPGSKIKEMLTWKGDYDKLENGHSFIQWLFPMKQASDFNSSAQVLHDHEAKAIQEDKHLQDRVLQAYRMMLDFYGMEIANVQTGQLRRCDDNWEERFHHLNRSHHNRRRLTRIVHSLGELGFQRYQAPFVTFLLYEAIVTRELSALNGGSVMYWIDAIDETTEREKMFVLWQEMCEDPIKFLQQTEAVNEWHGQETDQEQFDSSNTEVPEPFTKEFGENTDGDSYGEWLVAVTNQEKNDSINTEVPGPFTKEFVDNTDGDLYDNEYHAQPTDQEKRDGTKNEQPGPFTKVFVDGDSYGGWHAEGTDPEKLDVGNDYDDSWAKLIAQEDVVGSQDNDLESGERSQPQPTNQDLMITGVGDLSLGQIDHTFNVRQIEDGSFTMEPIQQGSGVDIQSISEVVVTNKDEQFEDRDVSSEVVDFDDVAIEHVENKEERNET